MDNVHWTSSSQCQVYHVKSSLTESLVKYLNCTVAMEDLKTPVINSLQYNVVVSIGECFTTDFAVSNNSGVFHRARFNQYFTLASLICDIYFSKTKMKMRLKNVSNVTFVRQYF